MRQTSKISKLYQSSASINRFSLCLEKNLGPRPHMIVQSLFLWRWDGAPVENTSRRHLCATAHLGLQVHASLSMHPQGTKVLKTLIRVDSKYLFKIDEEREGERESDG